MLLEPRGKERERESGRVGERGDEIDLIGPDTDHNFMLSKTEMVTAWTGGYKGTVPQLHTTQLHVRGVLYTFVVIKKEKR